jgi:hypothetical protein
VLVVSTSVRLNSGRGRSIPGLLPKPCPSSLPEGPSAHRSAPPAPECRARALVRVPYPSEPAHFTTASVTIASASA